ncbi:unnamed protein product [Owenia fusiformis]|uniref:Uncharacterized protein n=1 Tax=Owenia fusiformis TaxID=6347 RepID=A0A8J1TSQ3_OWEFU|nr:unnamed protein product [Owenia fusiformis]
MDDIKPPIPPRDTLTEYMKTYFPGVTLDCEQRIRDRGKSTSNSRKPKDKVDIGNRDKSGSKPSSARENKSGELTFDNLVLTSEYKTDSPEKKSDVEKTSSVSTSEEIGWPIIQRSSIQPLTCHSQTPHPLTISRGTRWDKFNTVVERTYGLEDVDILNSSEIEFVKDGNGNPAILHDCAKHRIYLGSYAHLVDKGWMCRNQRNIASTFYKDKVDRVVETVVIESKKREHADTLNSTFIHLSVLAKIRKAKIKQVPLLLGAIRLEHTTALYLDYATVTRFIGDVNQETVTRSGGEVNHDCFTTCTDIEAFLRIRRKEGAITDVFCYRLLSLLTSVIARVHNLGIVHNSICPSNIIVKYGVHDNDNFAVFVTGWGNATTVEQSCFTHSCRVSTSSDNDLYIAPELTRGDTPTLSSDVFSLGKVFKQIAKSYWILEEIIVDCFDIERFLDEDPNYRPSAEEVNIALHLRKSSRGLTIPTCPNEVSRSIWSKAWEDRRTDYDDEDVCKYIKSRIDQKKILCEQKEKWADEIMKWTFVTMEIKHWKKQCERVAIDFDTKTVIQDIKEKSDI